MDHAGELAGRLGRVPGGAAAALAASAILLAAVAAVGGSFTLMVAAFALLAAAPMTLLRTIPWHIALAALVLVIAFIPIRRYVFGTGLPIQLEPYRLFVALLLVGWVASLLVDAPTRLRKTGFERPIFIMGGVAVASVVANPARVAETQSEVIKSLSFLASFILIFFLVATVTRRLQDVEVVLKTFVASMTILGLLAVIESRTGQSPFARLDEFFPLISATAQEAVVRGAGTRARGSAETPIALGAALVLAVPIAIYLAQTSRRHRRWWLVALAVLMIGTLATLSRTGVLMLASVALVYIWLRPRETLRLWPLLVPFLAAVHFAAPGTLGTLKQTFLPEGGIVAEQARDIGGDCYASGRIADLGPTLEEVSRQPMLGIGFGTRIVVGQNANACILDSQVLVTLLETGIAGLLAWTWLFARFVRRLACAAARRTAEGHLSTALAASISAYAISMFTYDALGFIQVTFLLFLLMGLAASIAMAAPLDDRNRRADASQAHYS